MTAYAVEMHDFAGIQWEHITVLDSRFEGVTDAALYMTALEVLYADKPLVLFEVIQIEE